MLTGTVPRFKPQTTLLYGSLYSCTVYCHVTRTGDMPADPYHVFVVESEETHVACCSGHNKYRAVDNRSRRSFASTPVSLPSFTHLS